MYSCIIVDSVVYEFVNSREWYYTHIHAFYWMVLYRDSSIQVEGIMLYSIHAFKRTNDTLS
jgi:hypothetical protein